jgi:hypothetical protein
VSFEFGGVYPLYKYNSQLQPEIEHMWKAGIAATKVAAVYKMGAKVVFKSPVVTINPPLKKGQSCTASVRVKQLAKPNNVVIATKDGISLSGGNTTLPDITTDDTLSDVVKADKYGFRWEISFDGGNTWCWIGTAQAVRDGTKEGIQFYWTADAPTIPAGKMLFDVALQKACKYINGGTTYADEVSCGISKEISYAPNENPPPGMGDDSGGVLQVYRRGQALCVANAYLLQYLLKSVGTTSGEVVCYWGGPTLTKLKACKRGGICGSLTAIRPAKNGVPSNPWFYFHSMTEIGTTIYDPSYGQHGATTDFSNFCRNASLQTGSYTDYLSARRNIINNC